MKHLCAKGGLHQLVLCVLVCVLSGAACAAAASTGTVCGPTFNFYPAAGKNSSLPTAWTQAAQQAAGNIRSDVLYTVALTSNNNVAGINPAPAAPELTVVPVHDLLTVGSSPSAACRGVGAAVSAASNIGIAQGTVVASQRRLLQGLVTAPAHYRVQYSINSSTWKTVGEFEKTTPAPRIVLSELTDFSDGYYCMSIKLTIIAGSGLMGSTAVPLEDLWSTTQVCFVKLDNLPSANVTYTSCGSPFSVNISGMEPAPVSLYPGSADSLFNTVFHFQSTFNHTKDGGWPSEEPPTMDQWVVLSTAADAKQPYYLYTPDSQQLEGFWNVKLEGSLMTEHSSLLSLGIATIDKYTEETAAEEIQGKYKLAPNKMWPTGRLAGIQNVFTRFISLDGPDLDKIPVNSELSFNWDWDGFGQQYCFFDGLRYYNAEEFTCRPPLGFTLPDSKNHTLTVMLQDVCGRNHTFEAAYGTWGYQLTKVPNTTADAGATLLESGATYDTPGTSTTSTSVRRTATTSDAPSLINGRALSLLLPLLLLLLHVSTQ